MKQNKKINQSIIVLQGTAGVGKTAIARKLCNKLPRNTVRISVDILKDMISLGNVTMRQSDKYIILSKKISLNITKFYLKNGYNVIIELAPPLPFDKGTTDKWIVKELKKMGAYVFLLHSSLSEVIKRNKKRHGEFNQGNLSQKLIEKIYKSSEKYLNKTDYEIINTDKIGADKTASIILEKYIDVNNFNL